MSLLQAIIMGIKTQAAPLEKVLVTIIQPLIPAIKSREQKAKDIQV